VSGPKRRRDFLKEASATGVGFWVAGTSLGAQSKSPNEKLNLAQIGAGGKGHSDAHSVKSENIYALCDVDDRQAEQARKDFPQAKYYKDYRELLEKEGKSLDGVLVSTPDHSHAPASVMAMKMGLAVYCQKPLTRTVYEARVMRETATKFKVATQMGNQGTSNSGLRRAAEVVQAGGIGAVREVHVWTNRPIWPQGVEKPKTADEIPAGLDFDLWLGPAAERPYNNAYLPFSWRGWWDFGTGALGDMACHTLNLPFMALQLGYPTSVEAVTTPFNRDSFPMASHIKFEFPARGAMPPLTLHWYDGGLKPFADLFLGDKPSSTGSLLIGDKGTLFSPGDYGASFKLLPEKHFEGYQGPAEWIPRSPGHYREWLDAIRGGKPAMSNFDYAALLTESILLGNIAMAVGEPIEYDGPNMKVTNNKKANDYLHYEYRKGWTL
jgi:predicted dehydrogenase